MNSLNQSPQVGTPKKTIWYTTIDEFYTKMAYKGQPSSTRTGNQKFLRHYMFHEGLSFKL